MEVKKFDDMTYDDLLETILSYLDKIKILYNIQQRKHPTSIILYKKSGNMVGNLFIYRQTMYEIGDSDPIVSFSVNLSRGIGADRQKYEVKDIREFQGALLNLMGKKLSDVFLKINDPKIKINEIMTFEQFVLFTPK
jgi:hypothetical protein